MHSFAEPQAISAGVYAILVTQTLDALATMVVLPTIPFYAMGLGANAFTISLIGSAYNLAQMVCSPALGALSDRAGRKAVMVMGLTCQAMCNCLMANAETLPQLILARVAVGMALSTGPVEMAYIMDSIATERQLSFVLSLQRVMTSTGALLGPLVAKTFDEYSFPYLCRGLVCVNVLNLFIGITLWKDAPPKDDVAIMSDAAASPSASTLADGSPTDSTGTKPPTTFLGMLRLMLSNRATSALLLVSWVYTLGYGIGDGPEVVFFKEHFGFEKGQVCYFFVITNLSSLLFCPVGPYLINSFGSANVCKMGCLGAAASTLSLVAFSGTQWIPFVYGGAMVGLFGGMIGFGYMHLVRKQVPESMMGTMLGLQSSLNGFAGTIAPPTGGALYNLNSFLPYIITALFAAFAAGMYGALSVSVSPEEVEPIAATLPLVRDDGRPWRRPTLRRVSTFGKPIFPDKSFTSQVHLNAMSLEHDPELYRLYQAYRTVLDRERSGTGGLKPVATVPGDMAAARAQSLYERELSESDVHRSETHNVLCNETS